MDVEAIYEQADLLLDEFQDYLKDRGAAREDRASYDEVLQVFVDDYLAAYEVGKLTDMNRDEIDTYCVSICSSASVSRNGSSRKPSKPSLFSIRSYLSGVTYLKKLPGSSFSTASASVSARDRPTQVLTWISSLASRVFGC